MSDLDVLQELIYEGALIPLMETPYGGKIVVLGESDSQGGIQYSIKIKGIPDDSVVVKTDMFPSPRGIFSCQRGECKRADYVIVTNSETDNFIVHVEMKKGEGNASEMINQLKGSECFIAYCRAIVCRFSRLLQKSEDPLLPRSSREQASENVRHSRFRGNDGLKPTVGACGLSSLAVNLSHTLFRPGNPVFYAANTCMSRIFLQLAG